MVRALLMKSKVPGSSPGGPGISSLFRQFTFPTDRPIFVLAICPIVPMQLGFYGKTDVEAAQIDQIHTTIAEAGRLVMPFVQNMFATSPSDVQPVAVGLDTEEGVEKLRTHLPRYLNFLNSQVVANETVNGQDAEGVYFVGTSLSLADIYWACAWEIATELDTENTLLEDYPKLFNLAKRVSKLPAIQEYKRQHAEDHP